MYGVGSTSPHRMSFAWRSDNAALKQPEVQPMPTGTPYSDAYWRTQPTSDRWQFSTSMLPFQSSDFTSQYCTDSASASARDPDCSFQAAQVCYPQYNLMESQWQSPNNHCFSFQRHRSALQQPAQFDSALTAALSLTAAAGRLPMSLPETEIHHLPYALCAHHWAVLCALFVLQAQLVALLTITCLRKSNTRKACHLRYQHCLFSSNTFGCLPDHTGQIALVTLLCTGVCQSGSTAADVCIDTALDTCTHLHAAH